MHKMAWSTLQSSGTSDPVWADSEVSYPIKTVSAPNLATAGCHGEEGPN